MEEMNKSCYVFQVDSDIVQQIYVKRDNFLIEYDDKGDKNWCAIYFCSNDIYYPNTEEIFRKRIVEKNFFEWYHSRINRAYKHIFVRDVFKQWYLTGINARINTPEKLTEFLRKETEGYNIVTVGSSAGGYAAILHGSLLNAKYVLAFNPQFEIKSLLQTTTEEKNPILFRNSSVIGEYFDILKYINVGTEIFYFGSNRSKWDVEQSIYIGVKPNIYSIKFKSSHHGIPFLKVALPVVLNLNMEKLKGLSGKIHNSIWFTYKMVGLIDTVVGFYKQLYSAYQKRK